MSDQHRYNIAICPKKICIVTCEGVCYVNGGSSDDVKRLFRKYLRSHKNLKRGMKDAVT